MQAAAAGRYTCALIALTLVFQPVAPLPEESRTEDPKPFLSRALHETHTERVLSAVLPGPAAAAAPASLAGADDEAAAPAARTVRVVVREGQSLWSLAAEHGTTIEAILEANGLAEGTILRIGQVLLIPEGGAAGAPGAEAPAAPRKLSVRLRPGARIITIRLSEGQTLWDISQTYGATIDEIVSLNGLDSADYVRAGQRIKVPVYNMASIAPRRLSQTIATSAESVVSSVAALAQGFIWPARGRLTSRFGWRRWRHHDGIDIAAPYGAPITAARDGVVVFSGWYQAYGRAIIIDHGQGLQTLYGHAARLLVRTGQRVTKGQIIAHVGSTGRSTGPHLHFEVRINGRPVNPIKYL
ncbi:MAG TPA: peptidoglycan DD-metalloendopeptidase family protein [bacterium]|nr:peptidoglycan DD-metalloendopeptidase family protein [bacterium]